MLVDESQFLTRDQVYQLSEVVDQLGVPVLCFGLRTDFRGELFPGSQYLMAWADELKELKTICHTGKKATMVVRVDENGHALTEGAQVQIGGNERYIPVSRAEFKRVFHHGERRQVVQVGASRRFTVDALRFTQAEPRCPLRVWEPALPAKNSADPKFLRSRRFQHPTPKKADALAIHPTST